MSKIRTAIEVAKKRKRSQTSEKPVFAGTADPHEIRHESSLQIDTVEIETLRNVAMDVDTMHANRLLSPGRVHPAESSYRMLRTRVMRVLRNNRWRILGVSSVNPNEGKTYSSINLAISIAAEVGQNAVLVDLDLRRPSISSYLGIGDSDYTCVTQFLQEEVGSVRELLVSPGIDRLGCILCGSALQRPSDLLASSRGREFFNLLRGDLPANTTVIVDLPPIYSSDDALAISPFIDGLLLVVAEGQTKRSDLAGADRLVQEFNIIGTILNKSVEKDSRRTEYYY